MSPLKRLKRREQRGSELFREPGEAIFVARGTLRFEGKTGTGKNGDAVRFRNELRPLCLSDCPHPVRTGKGGHSNFPFFFLMRRLWNCKMRSAIANTLKLLGRLFRGSLRSLVTLRLHKLLQPVSVRGARERLAYDDPESEHRQTNCDENDRES
jgi:hypothetical protein